MIWALWVPIVKINAEAQEIKNVSIMSIEDMVAEEVEDNLDVGEIQCRQILEEATFQIIHIIRNNIGISKEMTKLMNL